MVVWFSFKDLCKDVSSPGNRERGIRRPSQKTYIKGDGTRNFDFFLDGNPENGGEGL